MVHIFICSSMRKSEYFSNVERVLYLECFRIKNAVYRTYISEEDGSYF